jgi:hypothetical protein
MVHDLLKVGVLSTIEANPIAKASGHLRRA